MDHAITIRDLVWIGSVGSAIAAVLGGVLWVLSRYNTDI